MSAASKRLILGTRGSGLALWQAVHVAKSLEQRHDGLQVEQRIHKTEGDVRAGSFGPGDRGVFVKSIERALLAGEIDFAVHSLKDLPSDDTPGLVVAAVPVREDPRDALVSKSGGGLDRLPDGATLGTGSPRRRSQLLLARPDLRIRSIRGNIDTRASRIDDGGLDGVVLAAAGLIRLGLDHPWCAIDPKTCVPAVGQGVLAIQARSDDSATIELLRVLEHPATRFQVEAERAFLSELGGGCMAPASAWARTENEGLRIDAMVAQLNGESRFVESCVCANADGPAEGRRLARRLNDRGAQHWIEQARRSAADG